MADDIVMPAPGEFGDAVLRHSQETLAKCGIDFNGAESFFTRELPEFDWIIYGLLAAGRDGERAFKGDIIAPSKCRKTFFAIQLGLSVASGRPICGYDVPKKRRVAYFNLELVAKGFQERLLKMSKAMCLDPQVIWRDFTPLTLRCPGDLRKDDVLNAVITTQLFRVDATISPIMETTNIYRTNQNANFRALKGDSDKKLFDSVLGKLKEELADRTVPADEFQSRICKETGWGINRVRPIYSQRIRSGELATTMELRRKDDGTIVCAYHGKTLVGTPEAIAKYRQAITQQTLHTPYIRGCSGCCEEPAEE